MALYPVSGCKIAISTTAVDEKSIDFVAADLTALVYTDINKWTQMGDVGDQAALITADIISESRTKKQKGTRNAGTMENVFANDPVDPGQLAVVAAEKTINNYGFKIELNDKPTVGASPTNSFRYFIALVTQARESGGAANTLRNLNVTLEINSNIVRVAAAAA